MNLVEFLQDLSLKGVKLWIEGGRLRSGGSQKVLTPDVTNQLQQYKTEILQLLSEHPDTFNVYPLSYGQKALWFLWQLAPESHAYNVSLSVRICEAVDITAMSKVFQVLMERHPILRTTFPLRGSEPIQHIHQNQELDFLQIDASSWSEDQLKAKVIDAHQIRFDLERGPIVRVRWFSCSDEEHILLLTMHHIACDRWSFEILLQELPKIYQAQRAGIEISLPPLKHSYQDYVSWQRKMLASAQGTKLWSYWQQQLAGNLPTLNLATDKQRGPIQTYNGASYRFKLSKTLTEQVKELAQREGVTFYMMLLAAFMLLLHRYTDQEDILVGSPSLGRSQAEFAEIFGCFTDPVVMRANLSGNPSFKDFLKQVRQTALQALTHQDYPFSVIVEKLQPHRDPSRPPIFQAFFALKQLQQSQNLLLLLENETEKNVDWGGMKLKPFEIPQQEGQFDLDFEIVESSSSVFGNFKYNSDLFEETTIERMSVHFQNLLSAIVGNTQQVVGELPLLSEAERYQLLTEWNDTESEYAIDKCIHQLFEEQVEKTPQTVAVVFDNHQLTYQQLNQRANQLAHHLKNLGARPEVLVGICMERSIEMVVGILGILKAGAAYVPFDPNYPQERLSYMLGDSGLGILLTQESLREILSPQQLQIVCLDTDWKNIAAYSQQNLDTEVSSSNLAYVIYTSGSTGKPKGVTIEHRQVINFFTGIDKHIGDDSPGTWLALTTICFDISVLELFWTLARGFQVIIATEQKKLFSSTTSKLQSPDKNIEFSLFYFASGGEQNSDEDKYKLLLEGAKFADRHGFSAVWTPERHFHQFGGLYPNPSVISAAIAAVTEKIKIRAGSVVIPLHDPIRVAEEWAVVDNLSHGRVGISFATGWQPNDFVLAPENYPQRKAVTLEAIETVRKLWRGEAIKRKDGNGEAIEIKVLPRPLQRELPTWMTASGNPETFKLAGKLGVNVLTHLLGQTIEELGEKINLYRQAWRSHGHSGNGHVTIMIHTFIGDDLETVRQQVYQPLSNYLRSSAELMKSIAVSMDQNPEDLSQADWNAMVAHAFNRYFETSGLLGTPEKCLQIINQLKAIDIDEVGCLIDFGVDVDTVISSLDYINALKEDSNQKHIPESDISSISTQISKYNVSHLQCTPSLLKMLPDGMSSLKSLSKILVGGEELSVSLAKEISSVVSGEIYNMYGPTEATIWSTIYPVNNCDQKLSIGKPIVNTQIYILDRNLQPVPIGIPGELYIGGNGLARGYLNRPELTKEKFIQNPFHNSKSERLYKTGDLARYLPNGDIEYLSRIDNQVKVRGFRIELGEIEAVLNTHPQIQQAVVIATEEISGNKRLVAYVVLDESLTTQHLRQFLKQKLPEYMVPAAFVTLDTLPLTPNGKLDRKALPAPDREITREDKYVAPGTAIEEILTNIWQELLLKEKVSIHDNFFEIGGDSILSIQLVSRAKNSGVQITAQQIFQNQTIAELARVANTIASAECEQGMVTGVAPLSPIQHWFFSQNREAAHHYNQSVLWQIPKNIKPEVLEKAVEKLLEHHDALRLRFTSVASEYKQINQGDYDVVPFSVVDLSSTFRLEQSQALEKIATEFQASLNLSDGPIMQVVMFNLGLDDDPRLLIIIHHLAVDGVSWRILLSDLVTIYQQLIDQQPIQLSAKTTAFIDWAEKLNNYAQSEKIKQELDYWLKQPWSKTTPLPLDYAQSQQENTVGSAINCRVKLSVEETRALLGSVNEAYNTQINDILLSALVVSLAQWTENLTVLIDLEGHGREELFEGVDLSRTVGWFTSLFPVLLQLPKNYQLASVIKSIKEQLRAIPNRGIGYGILRYLCEDTTVTDKLQTVPTPEISFNYLGQFDQVQSETDWKFISKSTGGNHSLRQNRDYLLDINALVIEGELQIDWTYSSNVHTQATVDNLAQSYVQAIRSIIEHCQLENNWGYTPSDFHDAQLNQLELDELLAPIKTKNVSAIYRLSPTQQGILFHSLDAPSSGVYQEQITLNLKGNLNVTAFESAWQKVVDRYSILRTFFVWENRPTPLQVVLKQVNLPWNNLDWQELSTTKQQQHLSELLQTQRKQGFQFNQAPLMGCTLIKLSEDSYKFIWNHHHILIDGWCLSIIFKDVLSFYEAEARCEICDLPKPFPYSDYIAWLHEQDHVAALDFWQQTLQGFSTPTPLRVNKLNFQIQQQQSSDYKKLELRLPQRVNLKLQSVAQQHRVTLSTIVQAAWALLLSRYSGEKDVVFGVTVSGRPANLSGVEEMVGLFVNTLPLRLQISPQQQIIPWLQQIQQLILELQERSYTPLVDIQARSEVRGGISLFESIVAFENYPVDSSLLNEDCSLQLSQMEAFEQTNYPLTVIAEPWNELLIKIRYDSTCFESDTIGRMLGHLQTIFSAIVENPSQAVGELPLLTEAERHQLLSEWNETGSEYPSDKCIHQLFEEQVERTPDAVAVVFDREQLTYQQLNQRANQLAHHLQNLGVGAEVLVGLCVERSVEMVVGLLGILKAGGAYVPLDPNYPQERLSYMLEDSGVEVLLTQQSLVESLPQNQLQVVCLDTDSETIEQQNQENLDVGVGSDNLAYVIYTSGSTGKPKGVTVPHQAVNRLVINTNYINLQPKDVIAFISNFSFDAVTFEIWGTLLHGAKLIWVSKDIVLSPKDFANFIQEQKISVLFLTTALFNQVVNVVPSAFHSVQQLMFGGEAVDIKSVKEVLKNGSPKRLLHVYGPTENTTFTTWYLVQDIPEDATTIPIGRPISNTQTYILDQHLQPVPIGVPGELYIGGDGLARSYLNRPEVTREKFIPNPFSDSKSQRLYKTGDLVRHLADGNIEFLGRIDYQVKIRGFRIESEEIEAVLKTHPQVQQAVVIVREDIPGNKRLVAYVVSEQKNQSQAANPLQSLHIDQWQEMYHNLYSSEVEIEESSYNTVGWESSYTGKRIPQEQMRQWADSTVEQILKWQPEHVLEIGCGTGMLLFQISPHCLSYCGTDFSAAALGYVEQQIKQLGDSYSHVSLSQKLADDFTDIEEGRFDAVILNSIVQYFPSVDYLVEVLEGAVKTLAKGGFIFIGDVRSLPLLETFHAATKFYRASDSLTIDQLRQQVKNAVNQDEELVIDPALFLALKQHLPQIKHVQIQLKPGDYHNELTKFRYQVILHVNKEVSSTVIPEWLDYQNDGLNLSAIQEILADKKPPAIGIKHIPNARLQEDVTLVQELSKSNGRKTVGQLRNTLHLQKQVGVEPDNLWSLSNQLPYEVYITWSGAGENGCYEAIFIRNESAFGSQKIIPNLEVTSEIKAWSAYANNPLKRESNRDLVAKLPSFLKQKLPEYMVPTAFVTLDSLPLTPNGKVDRKALSAPDGKITRVHEYVAPRTQIEQTLAKIWQELLILEKVSIHDNFFEIGGDSILSIQVVSRAKSLGIEISIKQIFQNPTIAKLARVANTRVSVECKQGIVTGVAPLTPIQHRFLAQNSSEAHHFNQSVLLQIPKNIKPELIEKAVEKLLEHHDALRLRFTSVASEYKQINQGDYDVVPFSIVDLSSTPRLEQPQALEKITTEFQTSLNLSDGPIMQVVMFNLGLDDDPRLLIIIHHLAVDGVSWRILLSDLETIYQQLIAQQPIQLSLKTTAFIDWAEKLNNYAQSKRIKQELDYWLNQLWSQTTRLPLDYAQTQPENTVGSAACVSVKLSQEETEALLGSVNEAYNTQINDILLSALVLSLAQWTGDSTVVIDLEGHGREELFEDVDLSRTVGWFTSLFPVLLQLPTDYQLASVIKSIKEQLRAIPNRGIGYGILRYLCEDATVTHKLQTIPTPEISFNYLGEFDQVELQTGWKFALESAIANQSSNLTREHLLDINGLVVKGELQINWTYSSNIHTQATVENLAQSYLQAIRSIIEHCQSEENTGYTPSDFPLAQLNQLELDELLAAIQTKNVSAIYPLSPTQQGMLFHSLYAPESGVYLDQLTLNLKGNLNVTAFEAAWKKVVHRYSTLRTLFVWKNRPTPLQVVIKQVNLPWNNLDWQGLSTTEQQQQLSKLLQTQRKQGFQFNQAPLMGCTLVKLSEDNYKFIWNHHHILIDGWCLSIIFKDVFSFYKAEVAGETFSLPTPRSYRDYIAWLQEQDHIAALDFWRQTLQGFNTPTSLLVDKFNFQNQQAKSEYKELELRLSAGVSRKLQDVQQHHGMTLSTIVQAAWALLLSRYSGEKDVVFGVTISGRPANLSGVEEIVGLFINTLPLRLQISPQQQLIPWLQEIQQLMLELQDYSYTPLVEIQSLSGVKRGIPLFDSIVVFENYPIDSSLLNEDALLQLSEIEIFGQNNYPLTVMAVPGDELFVKIRYNTVRFESDTIRRMFGHLETIFSAIAENPSRMVGELPLLNESEKQQLSNRNLGKLKLIKRNPITVLE